MQPDREGFVEVEPTLKVVHYRFAGELVLDVLVPGLPEQNARPKFETEIHKILMLAPVIRLIDNIVGWYGKDRQLL